MKKVIAFLLTLIMMFTVITPAVTVGATAADNSNDIVSTIDDNTDKDSNKKVSFFDKISQFFHTIFAKIAGFFGAKCPICNKKHDDDSDTDINIGGNIDTHIHRTAIRENRSEPTCGRDGSIRVITYCTICDAVINTEITKIPATGDHKYTNKGKTVRANCVEEGYTIMKCDCGTAEEKIILEIDSTNHKTVIVDEAKAPTCTEVGLEEGSHCEACDVVIVAQEEVPATGHTEETIPAVAPACTKTGLTEGKKCTVCGVVTVAQEVVDMLGHSYEKTITLAPACNYTGVATFTCETCGDWYTEAIDKLAHTEGIPVIENEIKATCTEDGSYEIVIYCLVCRTQLSRETIVVPATGHIEVIDAAKAATCTETGLTEGKHCSVCNNVLVAQTEVPATGHTEVTDAAVDATCEEAGLTEGKHCSVCTEVLVAQETVPAIGHTEVIDEEVAPTCIATGLTEGKHCSVCTEVLVAQTEVPATGHTEVIDVAIDATCEEAGLTEGKHCSVCTAVIVAQTEVPETGHTEVIDEAIDATCEEAGLTEGKHCSVCDKVLVAQTEVPALEHDYGEETVEPTCTNEGYTTFTCKRCSYGYTDRKENALGHSFKNYVSNNDAECEKDGTKTAKCDRCDVTDTVTDEGSAKGHDYDEGTITTAPTCENAGVKTYTCNNDSAHTKTESIAAVGHKDEAPIDGLCDECKTDICKHDNEVTYTQAKDATCTEKGNVEYWSCSICKKNFADETCITVVEKIVVDALGHAEISHKAKSPTCTEKGWDAYVTCSRCDYTTYSEKEALDHNEVAHEAKAPTCTAIGWDAYVTCSRCDYTTYSEKEALGHDEVAHEAQAATCTAIGWEAYVTCSRCDYTTYSEKSALGHNEVEHEAKAATCTEGGYDAHVACSRCDYSTYKEIEALGHNEVAHEAQAATCTAIGYDAYVNCSRCDYSTYKEIEALGHDEVAHEAKAPTCTAIGWDAYVTCSRCDYTSYVEKSKLPHKEETISAVEATCTKTGLTEGKKCSVCKEITVTQEEIPVKAHDFNVAVSDGYVAPTCTQAGSQILRCSTCESTEIETIEQLAHSYTGDYKNNEDGTHSQLCKNGCGKYGDAVAHEYEDSTYECPCGVKLTEKFKTKFEGDFLYRVGNANTVALGSLFEGTPDEGATVDVTVETLNDTAATGTYTVNKSDWTLGTIKFEGTGVVKVIISQDSIPCELYLEVINAKNITKAESATANDVVLLNNTSGTFIVSNGHTFYGNGFTVKLPTTSAKNVGQGFTGYISVGAAQDDGIANGGNLDNVRIEGPVYPEMYIYRDQAKITDKNDPEYGDGYNMRYFVNSVIVYGGNCTISNCYISGSRTALCLRGGNNVVIENTTLSGGSYANMQICAGSKVTLRDLTTVQVDVADSYGKGKTAHGLGIAVDSDVVDLYIEGELNQYNWLNQEKWNSIVPSVYQSQFPKFFTNNDFSKYRHYTADDPSAPYVNLAFIFACNWNTDRIHDKRTTVDYATCNASIANVDGGVYSKVNTIGGNAITEADLADPGYKSPGYNPVAPVLNFDNSANNDADDANDANDSYCVYNESAGTLKIGIKGSSKILDLSKVSVSKNGNTLSHTAYLNGNQFEGNSVTINAADGAKQTLTFKVTSDEAGYDKEGKPIEGTIEYVWTISVEVATLAYPAPEWNMGGVYQFDATKNAVYSYYGTSNGYGEGVQIYEGIKINYYDKTGKLVNLDLSGTTTHPTGSNNSNTNAFTYTLSDGSTLTMKFSSGWKSGATTHQFTTYQNKVYIYPQSLDNDNYIRAKVANQDFDVKIAYTFTDPNGQSISQTMQWYNAKANNSKVTTVQWKDFDSANGKKPSTCFTPETLITLADGSQVQTQHLKGDEMLLVWDFYNGRYATVPSTIIFNMGTEEYRVLNLKFSDGTVVRTINGHRFFDIDKNKFVVLSERDVSDYIGDGFVKLANGYPETVKLVDYSVDVEYTTSYSIMSAFHYNAIVGGLLTDTFHEEDAPLFEYFEIGENLKFDEEKMNTDIEEYGLYTYEEFADYLTFEQFVALNIQYMKISVGKGKATFEKIIELIDTYMK